MRHQSSKLLTLFALGISNLTANAQSVATQELSAINGSNGFVIHGQNAGDRSGRSVNSAGDVNGDGYDDVIIGAVDATPVVNQPQSGAAYVVFGSSQGFSSVLELSGLDGTNGFEIRGSNGGDFAGRSVSSAGDINNDGFDDVIIGADGRNPNGMPNAGSSYVVFGSNQAFSSVVELANLNGSNGFVINGENIGDLLGIAVSAAGDFNADGIDDIILGAYLADPNVTNQAGSSYVVYGSDQGFPAVLNLSTLTDSTGLRLDGVSVFDHSGISVGAAGDVNGDGMDDIIIGASDRDVIGITDAGASYVVFGSDQGFTGPFDLSTLNGTNGFTITGVFFNDHSGFSVNQAGDINADGVDDLIIGAPETDANNADSGSAYVVFGVNDIVGFPSTLELSTLNGTNGFVMHGKNGNHRAGFSVDTAGDFNGDGISDLMVSSHGADENMQTNSGSTYIVYGSDQAFSSILQLSSLDASTGIIINGALAQDTTSISISAAGDVNGDGLDDVIIGAALVDPNGQTNAGASYVVFGRTDLIFETDFESNQTSF